MRDSSGGQAKVFYGPPAPPPKPKKKTIVKPKPGYTVKSTSENSGYNVKGHRNPNPKIQQKAISGGYNKRPAARRATPKTVTHTSGKPVARTSSGGSKLPASRTPARSSAPAKATPAPKPTPAVKLAPGAAKYLQQLQATAKEYYGQYDNNVLTRWANDIAAKKGNQATIDYYLRGVKAGNATTDVNAKRAGSQIAAELDPAIAEYQRQIAQQNKDKSLAHTNISNVYARLLASTNADKASMLAQSQADQAKALANYDTSKGQIANNFQSAQQGTNNELARLGLSSVGSAATDKSARDNAYLSGLADVSKGNSASAMSMNRTSYDSLLANLAASGQAAGNAQLANSDKSYADRVAELTGKSGDLSSSRAAKVYSTYQALLDAQRARDAAAAQQRFLNEIGSAKLGISMSNAQSNADYRKSTAASSAKRASRPVVVPNGSTILKP